MICLMRNSVYMSVLMCVSWDQSLVCVLVKYFKPIAMDGLRGDPPSMCCNFLMQNLKSVFLCVCVQILATNFLKFMRENQLTTYINVK